MFEKIVVGVLIVALFLAVWRLESGWRIVFTPFLLAMYWELVRIFPAFFASEAYAGVGGSYAIAVAFTGYLALLAGFFTWYCLPRVRPDAALMLTKPRTQLDADSFDSMAVLAMAIALGSIGLYFFGGLPATVQSSFSLLTGGGDAELARLVSLQRLELTKGAYFGAEYRGQGVVSEFQQVGWTLICVYALLRHLEIRSSASLLTVATALLGAWVFVAGFGARAPFLNILICMLAAYSLRQPMSVRTMGVVAAAGIAAAILLGVYSNKMYFLLTGALGVGDFLAQAVTTIVERTLIGNGLNDIHAIEFVSAGTLDIGYGAHHLRDFRAAMPGVQAGMPLAYQLYLLINESGSGTTFHTGTYLSKVFVDFYWPGVIVIFGLIGTALAVTQQWLLARTGSVWSVAVAVCVAFAVMSVLRGGPVSLATTLFVLGSLCAFRQGVRQFIRLLARAGRGPQVGVRASHG